MALTRINNQALTNVTSAGLPSGTVLQVKSNEIATTNNGQDAHKTTTSTSGDDTGASLSFTPVSSSSKLFITATLMGYNPNSGSWTNIGIMHDGTFLVESGQHSRDTEEESLTLIASVDSGNTNARTIKLRQNGADAGTKSFKSQSIMVMEVAG